jgi:hypothetical protein
MVQTPLKIKKLSTVETVRYLGRTSQGEHGIYVVSLIDSESQTGIRLELTLEAMLQLKTRIDAAFEHMKTH